VTNLRYIDGSLVGKTDKPGMCFEFRLATPCWEIPCREIPCRDAEEFALLLEHDDQNDANVFSLLRLADEEKAPYCVSKCPSGENSSLSKEYDRVVLPAEGQRLDAANETEDFVYSYVNEEPIRPEARFVHAALHTVPGCAPQKGALGLAIDRADRLYVLTALESSVSVPLASST